jgi:hypothetical protein
MQPQPNPSAFAPPRQPLTLLRGELDHARLLAPADSACAEERLSAALAEHNRVLASAWRARRWRDRARAPLHPRAARLCLYHAATGRARG